MIMSGPWSLWQLSALVLNMTPAINPSQESISRKKKKPYIKLIPGSSDVKIKKKFSLSFFHDDLSNAVISQTSFSNNKEFSLDFYLIYFKTYIIHWLYRCYLVLYYS